MKPKKKQVVHPLWKSELKALDLPAPEHKYGYPTKQLLNCLSAYEMKKLDKFMYGQTCVRDNETGDIVLYIEDVVRGLRLIRFGTPTYFD
jgi:hypothetical protein